MIDFDSFTKTAFQKLFDSKKEEFIKKMNTEGVFLYGAKKLGYFCKNQLENSGLVFRGFLESDCKKWSDEEKIYSPEILKRGDAVIITSDFYYDISRRLRSLGVEAFIWYEQLAYMDNHFEIYDNKYAEMSRELESNAEKYKWIYKRLTDEVSERVLDLVLKYRLSLDRDYTLEALELSRKSGIQDFDNVVTRYFNKEYSFFDVGGYDGESTRDWIKICPDYRRVVFFEPDPGLLDNVEHSLANYTNIEYVTAAVGNHNKKTVLFNTSGQNNGFISDTGDLEVPIVTLDDYVDNHKSFIKMDVEGYEEQALLGGRYAIEKYKPIMSISIYHLPGDMHKLIDMVLNWNPDYKIYIRHYTSGYADTRCYFIDED